MNKKVYFVRLAEVGHHCQAAFT